MHLVGTVKSQLDKLNQYTADRGYPQLQWMECWGSRCFNISYNGQPMKLVPGYEISSDEAWHNQRKGGAGVYFMNNEGTSAINAINALDAWTKGQPPEDLIKAIGTELEPYACIALEHMNATVTN